LQICFLESVFLKGTLIDSALDSQLFLSRAFTHPQILPSPRPYNFYLQYLKPDISIATWKPGFVWPSSNDRRDIGTNRKIDVIKPVGGFEARGRLSGDHRIATAPERKIRYGRVRDGLVLCRRRHRISGPRDLAEQQAGDQAAVEKRAASMLDDCANSNGPFSAGR
jgi:hypothetical protein